MHRTRITTRQGAVFVTELHEAEAMGRILEHVPVGWVEFETVTGCEMFPPEHLSVRVDEIVSVQSFSDENWAIQVQHETDHYRRLLDETPQDRMVAAFERMVEADD